MDPMVIVGAGECGTRAAFTLREQGWDGGITLVGAEPSPPYERPPLSKTGELKPICDEDMLRDQEYYVRRELLPGAAPFNEPTPLNDGRALPLPAVTAA